MQKSFTKKERAEEPFLIIIIIHYNIHKLKKHTSNRSCRIINILISEHMKDLYKNSNKKFCYCCTTSIFKQLEILGEKSKSIPGNFMAYLFYCSISHLLVN